jgi:BirA family biotin operon repressor/biotin-[acetyl-CoA-carboxylase] ligase
MEEKSKIQSVLEKIDLSAWQYYPSVGSTNDLALDWAQTGAPDMSLIIADEQTAGRGRGDRRWVTHSGSALAMSLVLRPKPEELDSIQHFTALAALGLIRALAGLGLQAELKWPNDVLLGGKKAAGVLVEADWQGDRLDSLVVGMGVNVSPESVPKPDQLRYPAISVEDALGAQVDRWALLGEILQEIMHLRSAAQGRGFLKSWNEALAFRGQWVWFRKAGSADRQPRVVRIIGVGSQGELVYENESEEEASALAGEILMAYHQNKDGLDTLKGEGHE